MPNGLRGYGTRIHFDLTGAGTNWTDWDCRILQVKPSGQRRNTSAVEQCLNEDMGIENPEDGLITPTTGVITWDPDYADAAALEAAVKSLAIIAWAVETPSFTSQPATVYQIGQGWCTAYEPQEIRKNELMKVDIVLTPNQEYTYAAALPT